MSHHFKIGMHSVDNESFNSLNPYRLCFKGKENDNEMKGDLSQQAYGMNSEYAGLINAGTGFAADMVGAGPFFIEKTVSNFAKKPNFINSVTLFIDGKDVIDLATEIAKTAIYEIHSEKRYPKLDLSFS